MITSYYTLYALVQEWRADLVGCLLGDAFSQVRGELTLALAKPDAEWMIRLSVQAPFRFLFRSEGYNKARRNVATLFENAFDLHITDVRLAERDRMVYFDLEDGSWFQVVLFGPRANVYWVGVDGRIREAFRNATVLVGEASPSPRPAPQLATFADFAARWRTDRKKLAQAVAAAVPFFDRMLATEAIYRSGLQNTLPQACSAEDLEVLWATKQHIQQELAKPQPRIYWKGRFADAFSLIPLHHLSDVREEIFDNVDAAVGVFVRRTLGQRRFRELYEPLEKALVSAEQHYRTRTERMLDDLAQPSRADRYEHWGHLLMATASNAPKGKDEIRVPDLFSKAQEAVAIPLDPLKTPVENAQQYYDKARRTRQARLHAEDRLIASEQVADEAGVLLDTLRQQERLRDLQAFRKAEAERLARFMGNKVEEGNRLPFRRYVLTGGYEVWVGRNAKQNDALTFRHAQKYDLWMHARGVPGSHAVLRLPNRQAQPGTDILERAASIAAYHSKAQGSHLVPVIITPRKFVRKPRGATPGQVLVEREDVLLVEPKLPQFNP